MQSEAKTSRRRPVPGKSVLPLGRVNDPQAALQTVNPTTRLPEAVWNLTRIPVHAGSARVLQTKLTVNRPGDRWEGEADRIADQVMRTETAPSAVRETASPGVQRACTCGGTCSDCAGGHEHDPEHLQRKEAASSGEQTTMPASVEETLRGPGRPLDAEVRGFMETRFGHDFSGVRVHAGAGAARSAREIHAHAYTVGRDIVFGANQFSPQTREGRRLIAHELTHVVQQSGGASLRSAQGIRPPVQGGVGRSIQRAPAPKDDPAAERRKEIAASKSTPGEFKILSGYPIVMSFYNFAINDWHLKAEHKANLKVVGELFGLIDTKQWQVTITGNADSTGGPKINDPLSESRANEVERYLGSVTKGNYVPHGSGANDPIASNESASGRTQNRRVDVIFRNPSLKIKPLLTPKPKKEVCKEHPELCDEDKWCKDHPHICGFCNEHPYFCGFGVLCMLFPAACGCLVTPLVCACGELPVLCACVADPSLCLPGKKKPKEKEKPTKKRACPTHVNLPSGKIEADKLEYGGIAITREDFVMQIDFAQDSSGCDCSCGEYLQEVRGYFEVDRGNGWQPSRHPLANGAEMQRAIFKEDGHVTSKPYGHRDSYSSNPGDGTDSFLPDRKSGCAYRGTDAPQITTGSLDRGVRMHLDFRAGPVDTCTVPGLRTELTPYWRTWTIDGEAHKTPPPANTIIPHFGPGGDQGTPSGPGQQPASPRLPTNAGPGKGGSKVHVQVAQESNEQGKGPGEAFYAGGIPADASTGTYEVLVGFFDQGVLDVTPVTARIDPKVTNADSVTIEFLNDRQLDLNHEHPGRAVLLPPHTRETIARSQLRLLDPK